MVSLFAKSGVHAVVDGQFGSTGKGALAAWLAEQTMRDEGGEFDAVISNAGPNSGHTFYRSGEKHVLKQLPTFGVYLSLAGQRIPIFLTGGAIIDPEILFDEANRYPRCQIYVHRTAAVIYPEDKLHEQVGSIAAVAGTRSGTGAALIKKIERHPMAVFGGFADQFKDDERWPPNVQVYDDIETVMDRIDSGKHFDELRLFMEVSQGFSLGLHSPEFYPKVTSRECTVMQGIADARIPPHMVARTYVSLRTFPIRVGNVDGHNSGGCYPDQKETSWEELGQEPELTTVTKRVRRVFTFSEKQAADAINANGADFVFINFMNYLSRDGQLEMLQTLDDMRSSCYKDYEVIQGYGPKVGDVKW